MTRRCAIALALALAPGSASAEPELEPVAPPPAPAPPPPTVTPFAGLTGETSPTNDDLADRIDELEAKQRELERALARTEGTRAQVEGLLPLRRYIKVFVDVGAFAVAGDGSGIRSDIDHVYYPQYAGRLPGQWVFMGDPLATAINSLGEPADTSDSREDKVDTIHSHGRPSLIVNSVGIAIGKDLDDGFSLASLAELLPRPGPDLLDVELAYLEYRPSHDVDLRIQAGKVDSVLGVEYLGSQDAPKRLGVTPSLICRYTCGRPLGVVARLVTGQLSASAAITDGDNFQERFEPDSVLKSNAVPTAAAHVQWTLPVGQGLELGASMAIGPQDKQPDESILQWHVGFDARLTAFHGFDIAAEYVQGLQQGKTTTTTPCNAAPCLTYKGGYVLVDRPVRGGLTPYVRVDWRDAVHQNGVEFVYESHVMRATVGANYKLSSRIMGKIEYTFVHELDQIPEFADDVLTSSVVLVTD